MCFNVIWHLCLIIVQPTKGQAKKPDGGNGLRHEGRENIPPNGLDWVLEYQRP